MNNADIIVYIYIQYMYTVGKLSVQELAPFPDSTVPAFHTGISESWDESLGTRLVD